MRMCRISSIVAILSVFTVGTVQAQTPYSLEVVVKAGDPAPGTGGGTFAGIPRATTFLLSARSANGLVAFVANISGGNVDTGIFVREPDGTLRVVVLADSAGVDGTPLPGFPGSFGIGEPCPSCAGRATRLGAPGIDESGRVAFVARVAGPIVDKGLYLAEPDGTLKIVALSSFNLGDRTTSTPVPGLEGATILDFHFLFFLRGFDEDAFAPSMNRDGEIAFYALSDRPFGFFFAESVLVAKFEESATVATLRKAAMSGDPTPDPGDPPIGLIGNVPRVSLNSSGDVAFDEFPTFPGPTRRYFMADASGNLTKLVQTDDSVSSPQNATIRDFVFGPRINDDCVDTSASGPRACLAAFFARLEHPDVTGGIFLRDTDGISSALVLADGDGPNGTSVPNTSHTFSELLDPLNLTDTGRLSFRGIFERGCSQGIFAWLGSEVVTVAKDGDTVAGLSSPLFKFGAPFLNSTNDVLFTASLAEKFVKDCYADGSFAAAEDSKELSWSTVNAPQAQVGFVEFGNNDEIFSALPNLPLLGTVHDSTLNTPTMESAPAGSGFVWTLATDLESTIQLKLLSGGAVPSPGRLQLELRLLVNGEVLATTPFLLAPPASRTVSLILKQISGTNHLVVSGPGINMDVTGPEVDAIAGHKLVEIRYGATGDELTQYRLEQVIISSEPISSAVFLARASVQLQLELLADLLASFNLQQGIAGSLDAKLQNALEALEAANADLRQDASNKLMAFFNAVEAQRDKELTSAQADELIALTARILASL